MQTQETIFFFMQETYLLNNWHSLPCWSVDISYWPKEFGKLSI